MDTIESSGALATLIKYARDDKDDARQHRIDMFACAAMQSLMVRPLENAKDAIGVSKMAYVMAESMEAERERRVKGGTK